MRRRVQVQGVQEEVKRREVTRKVTMDDAPCTTAVKLHPSQLFLPFSEGQPTTLAALDPESTRSSLPAVPAPCALAPVSALGTSAKRLDSLRSYLRRNFPGFVLQQRTQPAGTVQLSLYRVPDGAFYRINVASRFLEGDWLEELDGFLEYHGLTDKIPASVLSPVIIDREGIHVPKPPVPPEEGGDLLRSRLRKILGWKGKEEEATGLSFAP